MIIKLPGLRRNNKADDDLIKEFCEERDPDVLGVLYSRYMHLVYGVCIKYLKDREEAKDSVIAIFEKLLTEISRHKIENFSSWLHTVTKNYCLMKLRTEKTDNKNLKEWWSDQQNFMESDELLHPLDEGEPEKGKDLAECLEKLNDMQKDCILKFYYENKCYREIAEVMGTDEKKVKSLLQNGKRNLKLCMEEKNGREEK